jgi:hypothetical protein
MGYGDGEVYGTRVVIAYCNMNGLAPPPLLWQGQAEPLYNMVKGVPAVHVIPLYNSREEA